MTEICLVGPLAPTLTTTEQAAKWAAAMLRPGTAVVLAVRPADTGRPHEVVTVVDTDGRILLDTEQASDATLPVMYRHLLRVTDGRRLLAYPAGRHRELLLSALRRHDLDPEHLAWPDMWGCLARLRGIAAGHPEHYWPLDAHHHGSAATAALQMLYRIAIAADDDVRV